MNAPWAMGDTTAAAAPWRAARQPGANDAGPESLAVQMAEAARAPLAAFQIGMHWFPSVPAGSGPHCATRWRAPPCPMPGVAVRGMVAGTGAAAADTHGAIAAFAQPGTSVPARLLRARACVRERLARRRSPTSSPRISRSTRCQGWT